jgi:hypothetical protein
MGLDIFYRLGSYTFHWECVREPRFPDERNITRDTLMHGAEPVVWTCPVCNGKFQDQYIDAHMMDDNFTKDMKTPTEVS